VHVLNLSICRSKQSRLWPKSHGVLTVVVYCFLKQIRLTCALKEFLNEPSKDFRSLKFSTPDTNITK